MLTALSVPLQYRLVLKDGKVKIEMLNCTGQVCDVKAEEVRQALGLGAPVEVKYKPEYARPADTEVGVTVEAT